MTIELLKQAAAEARSDLATIDAARGARVEEAKRAIYAEFADRRAQAAARLRDADRAVEVEQEAESRKHPWFGKTVSRTLRKETEIGVVQVRTDKTVFPRFMVDLPAMGSLFVRLLKSNGRPGLRFASWDGRQNGAWQLDEGNDDANG